MRSLRRLFCGNHNLPRVRRETPLNIISQLEVTQHLICWLVGEVFAKRHQRLDWRPFVNLLQLSNDGRCTIRFLFAGDPGKNKI